MPEIAWIMAPTTSLSSVTWPSISFARSRPRAPCASRSSGRDGRTHISPKSSPKSEMRLPWALALSRDLDVQYKTAFVLAHKIREAMASEVKSLRLGGVGRHVEIDGCYVGGHVRPENRKADRKDLRLAENRSGRRQVVVVIRERALAGTSLGGTLPAVFASEDAALAFIKARVDRATTVHADEAPAWNALHARFDTKQINHSVEYANDDACTNGAESFFSRARHGEIGHYHHLSGVYLLRYARELAWREDGPSALSMHTVCGRKMDDYI